MCIVHKTTKDIYFIGTRPILYSYISRFYNEACSVGNARIITGLLILCSIGPYVSTFSRGHVLYDTCITGLLTLRLTENHEGSCCVG